MPSLSPETRAQRWPLLLIVGSLVLLFVAALAANLLGIYLCGGIAGWQQWFDAHAPHFFVWRLCLYAALLAAWPWARRRRRRRDPDSARALRTLEVLSVGAIVFSEASQWLHVV
ncbi:hypothetical protein [Acerihabitans arboris]|uniref:Uncharacterized protein n=1 Tax=Acerihabitans arboris TaxID=2691583 RepID=A0A845SZ94_9GAMM|nr:hypothetical protein [Acerihabitans arboris]NDL66105.1 hypothetical protein [Acerihabitans arboris]